MSITIEDNFITDLKLKGNELLIYAYIYRYSYGMNGAWWGSRKTLSRLTGASVRTIDNTLQKLRERGLIAKEFKRVNGVIIPWYAITDYKNAETKREEYKKYLLADFSSVAKDVFFKHVEWSFIGDNVAMTLERDICIEFKNKLQQQNEFYNLQHKTGYELTIIIEKGGIKKNGT